MNPEKEICSCCGQVKRSPNSHNLTKGLVDTLIIFTDKITRKGQNRLHVLKSGMGVNRTNNFQKLKYFGLVAKSGDTAGVWSLTRKGKDFLNGDQAVEIMVSTFNNRVVLKSTIERYFKEFKKSDEYWQKEFNIEIENYKVTNY